ncbi:hypothetical protein C9374_007602 [Naegleria lovaniensis]|uniref:Uncharacterized protein n=1 Tax=Naegleria lovaniensis TaxID=51637 RepID=A0AA88GK28_NAELO|nr:uncharacterized protein C9374_007602 [Naegleria lovaniensis]KAG2378964.1 hypothetical protein C9374_007602 [Naegleria lovaniensis]
MPSLAFKKTERFYSNIFMANNKNLSQGRMATTTTTNKMLLLVHHLNTQGNLVKSFSSHHTITRIIMKDPMSSTGHSSCSKKENSSVDPSSGFRQFKQFANFMFSVNFAKTIKENAMERILYSQHDIQRLEKDCGDPYEKKYFIMGVKRLWMDRNGNFTSLPKVYSYINNHLIGYCVLEKTKEETNHHLPLRNSDLMNHFEKSLFKANDENSWILEKENLEFLKQTLHSNKDLSNVQLAFLLKSINEWNFYSREENFKELDLVDTVVLEYGDTSDIEYHLDIMLEYGLNASRELQIPLHEIPIYLFYTNFTQKKQLELAVKRLTHSSGQTQFEEEVEHEDIHSKHDQTFPKFIISQAPIMYYPKLWNILRAIGEMMYLNFP